jgi:glucokinase
VVREVDGPACACGLAGCLEAVASGSGIARLAQRALDGGAGGSLAGRSQVSATEVYAAAAAGDPVALRITTDAGGHLARAIHELVMTYDLGRVLLGGGVTHAGEAFLRPLHAGLDALRDASPLAREALPADLVTVLPPEADPAGWGAVVLAESAAARGPLGAVRPQRPATSGLPAPPGATTAVAPDGRR